MFCRAKSLVVICFQSSPPLIVFSLHVNVSFQQFTVEHPLCMLQKSAAIDQQNTDWWHPTLRLALPLSCSWTADVLACLDTAMSWQWGFWAGSTGVSKGDGLRGCRERWRPLNEWKARETVKKEHRIRTQVLPGCYQKPFLLLRKSPWCVVYSFSSTCLTFPLLPRHIPCQFPITSYASASFAPQNLPRLKSSSALPPLSSNCSLPLH